jgi:hypothetical protein
MLLFSCPRFIGPDIVWWKVSSRGLIVICDDLVYRPLPTCLRSVRSQHFALRHARASLFSQAERQKVSHSCKSMHNIIVLLYISIFGLVGMKEGGKGLLTEYWLVLLNLVLS